MSKKRQFRQFFCQNVQETVRFFADLHISGGLEGLFNFYDPLHHHPWRGAPPTNSRRTKQFWNCPRGL